MDILTIKEAAKYLRVPYCQVYNLVRSGLLSGFRVGRHWRLPKKALDEWVKNQIEIENTF